MSATILCIKWGTLFSTSEVNTLFRACRAHTRADLRFVCLTDDARGLAAGIEHRPIPDIGLSSADIKRPGVWRKLALYHPDLHDLGQVLFIDLDMMIVGALDSFFATPSAVTFLDTGPQWRPHPRSGPREAGTGVFTFDPRRDQHVLRAFLDDPQGAMARYRNEQDFVADHIGPYTFWPDGHVVSFKRHLCYRYGVGLVRSPDAPAPPAAIVAFHGTPRPSETRQNLIWGPAPHWHMGQVRWIEDYYATFGTG